MKYLTTEEVAEETRVPAETLRYYRHSDPSKGPRSFKLGRRVLYAAEDVSAWVESARKSGAGASA